MPYLKVHTHECDERRRKQRPKLSEHSYRDETLLNINNTSPGIQHWMEKVNINLLFAHLMSYQCTIIIVIIIVIRFIMHDLATFSDCHKLTT
jgi:hypothetical protein